MTNQIENTAFNSVHIANLVTEKIRVDKSMALTLTQKKIILYLASLIQTEDTEFSEITISFSDYFKLMCLDYSGGYKDTLEKSILNFCSKCFFLPLENGQYKIVCRWLAKASIDYTRNELHLKLDDTLKPYFLNLTKKARTIFQLGYVLQFKCKYSPDLYLFACRCKNMNFPYLVPIEDAYSRFGNNRYKNYTDFNRFILKKALDEVNEKSDLKVIIHPIRNQSGKTTHIALMAFKKTGKALEQANTWKNTLLKNKSINDKVKEAFEDDILVDAVSCGYLDPEDPDEFAGFDHERYLEHYKKYITNDEY